MGRAARRLPCRNITFAIPHHQAARQVNIMAARQIENHVRLWLAAVAFPQAGVRRFRVMGAEGDISNNAAAFIDDADHVIMKRRHVFFREIIERDAALIGDDEDFIPRRVRHGDGAIGPVDHDEVFNAVRIARVDIQDPVAVKKKSFM